MPITQQEWLNENSYRAYPIKETVSRCAVTDGLQMTDLQIPNYMFVDFVLTSGTNTRIYLSKLGYIGDFLSLELRDQDENQVATVAVNIASHTPFARYPITGVGNYDDARGVIVLGDLSRLSQDLAQGSFNFTLDTAEMEPCTIRPDLRGVRSLQAETAGVLTAKLTGHVRLVAGDNIKFTYMEEANAIRIDAIDASGFEDECPCIDEFQLPCVQSINGIAIEDVQIVGDKCIQVVTSGNQITLTDKCSEPCCGCIELEFLTRNLDLLEGQLSRLEGYADQMRERLIQFITNVLVSI